MKNIQIGYPSAMKKAYLPQPTGCMLKCGVMPCKREQALNTSAKPRWKSTTFFLSLEGKLHNQSNHKDLLLRQIEISNVFLVSLTGGLSHTFDFI